MVIHFILPGRWRLRGVPRVHSFEDAQTSKVFQGQLQSSENRASGHVGTIDARLALFADLPEPC